MGRRILFIPHNPIERWLNKKIYENRYVYLDRWSFVHLASGIFLGWFFYNIWIVHKPWLFVLLTLIGYEYFEYLNWGTLFRKETFKNIWWDIKIGMIGFWIYFLFIK